MIKTNHHSFFIFYFIPEKHNNLLLFISPSPQGLFYLLKNRYIPPFFGDTYLQPVKDFVPDGIKFQRTPLLGTLLFYN